MKNKILQFLNALKVKTAWYWQIITWPTLAVLILAILAGGSLGAFWLIASQATKQDALLALNSGQKSIIKILTETKSAVPSYYVRRQIDGVYVDPQTANNYPVAVMIDNDPNGRPPAGLARANVVYEAKAESGITRYLAIFADGQTLDKIGPVRSARPYYIDWAQGYNALYVHVGGSPEALARLQKEPTVNLNEFYQGNYFWRANDYAAPHNVFTSSTNINQYLVKMNLSNGDYDGWLYKDEAELKARATSDMAVNFSVYDFLAHWRYDKEKNEYARYLAGVPHQDASLAYPRQTDGTPIIAKNIIIMKVSARVIDSELRRKMDTIGSGKAWYCLDGGCNIGKWRKENKQSREKIYDEGGEEIKFNAGTTWIEVVQEEGQVAIQN